MSGLTADKMTNLYADLTSQITKSVKNIGLKSEQGFTLPQEQSPAATPSSFAENASFTGYAFSYLEPTSLYNIHQIKTKLQSEEQVKEHAKNQNPVLENEDQANQADNDNLEQIKAVSFMDELQNNLSLDAKSITKLYQQNSRTQASVAPLYLSGNNFAMHDTKYATDAYNFTFNINNMPDMRIEYMHKFNRSYDYRI